MSQQCALVSHYSRNRSRTLSRSFTKASSKRLLNLLQLRVSDRLTIKELPDLDDQVALGPRFPVCLQHQAFCTLVCVICGCCPIRELRWPKRRVQPCRIMMAA